MYYTRTRAHVTYTMYSTGPIPGHYYDNEESNRSRPTRDPLFDGDDSGDYTPGYSGDDGSVDVDEQPNPGRRRGGGGRKRKHPDPMEDLDRQIEAELAAEEAAERGGNGGGGGGEGNGGKGRRRMVVKTREQLIDEFMEKHFKEDMWQVEKGFGDGTEDYYEGDNELFGSAEVPAPSQSVSSPSRSPLSESAQGEESRLGYMEYGDQQQQQQNAEAEEEHPAEDGQGQEQARASNNDAFGFNNNNRLNSMFRSSEITDDTDDLFGYNPLPSDQPPPPPLQFTLPPDQIDFGETPIQRMVRMREEKRKQLAEARAAKQAEEERTRAELQRSAEHAESTVLRDDDNMSMPYIEPVRPSIPVSTTVHATVPSHVQNLVSRASPHPPPPLVGSLVSSVPAAVAPSVPAPSPVPPTTDARRPAPAPAAAPRVVAGTRSVRAISATDDRYQRTLDSARAYMRFEPNNGINPRALAHLNGSRKAVNVPVAFKPAVERVLHKEQRMTRDKIVPGVTTCRICIYGTYKPHEQQHCHSALVDWFRVFHNVFFQTCNEMQLKILTDSWNRDLVRKYREVRIKNAAPITPSDVERHFWHCLFNKMPIVAIQDMIERIDNYLDENEMNGIKEAIVYDGNLTGLTTLNDRKVSLQLKLMQMKLDLLNQSTVHNVGTRYLTDIGENPNVIAPYQPRGNIGTVYSAIQAKIGGGGRKGKRDGRGTNMANI